MIVQSNMTMFTCLYIGIGDVMIIQSNVSRCVVLFLWTHTFYSPASACSIMIELLRNSYEN